MACNCAVYAAFPDVAEAKAEMAAAVAATPAGAAVEGRERDEYKKGLAGLPRALFVLGWLHQGCKKMGAAKLGVSRPSKYE